MSTTEIYTYGHTLSLHDALPIFTIQEFVALTATNHAAMYGLSGRKGTIAIGADADLALWNPDRKVTVTTGMLHDNVGYTPYEGRKLRGWPEIVLSRGRVVVENNTFQVERGSGRSEARRGGKEGVSPSRSRW